MLAAIRIVRSNGFKKFTIHSLDFIDGSHDIVPPIIYQKALMDLTIGAICMIVISPLACNVHVVAFAFTLFRHLA